jgi:hypothetical protein
MIANTKKARSMTCVKHTSAMGVCGVVVVVVVVDLDSDSDSRAHTLM